MKIKPSLKVRDLMSSDVISSLPEYDLGTICDLMLGNNIHHVPVVSETRKLIGIVTYRDLLRYSLPGSEDRLPSPEKLSQIKIESLKLEQPLTCDPETDLVTAARDLCRTSNGCLPVTQDGRLVGILTETDFVHFIAYGLER